MFNVRAHFKFSAVCAILIILATSAVDFLSMDHETAAEFAKIRVGISCLVLLLVATVIILDKFKIRFKDHVEACFGMACIAIAGGFLIFIQASTSEKLRFDVSIGILTVIVLQHFVLYRFKRIHRAWAGGLFIILIAAAVLFNIPTFSLIASHLACTVVAVFYRHRFYTGLARTLSQLKRIAPTAVAERLILSDGVITDEAFKAKNRYCVSLISDWRDFQSLTESIANSEISAIFEKYYDIIYRSLERIIPSGEYFVEWHADELFIVFYSENEDKQEVHANAIKFTEFLMHEAFEHLQKISPKPIMFDVGLSCGYGLLGIMGPNDAKKTTIASEVPGRAKRMEGEAKAIRKSVTSAKPIVVVDGDFAPHTGCNIKPWIATSKNIDKEKVYYTLSASSNHSKNKESEKEKIRLVEAG